MTLADVLQAKQALGAAGEVASANKILARLGSGSKKTVLKYLHQLAAAGETFTPAPPVPAPVPEPPARLETAAADPVCHAPVEVPAVPPTPDPERTARAPGPSVAVVPPPPRPVSAAPEAGPVPTLLAQAAEALRQAQAAEHQARRARETPGSEVTWDDVTRAVKARQHAQDQVEKLQRSTASLIAAIPSMRIDVRRTSGALAALEEQTQRSLIKVRREAQQAREALDRMEADLVSIAGRGSLPVEE